MRTDLEGVEALTQFYLADGRKKGFTLAVRFLENYLKANPDEIHLSREEAVSFPDVRDARMVNISRFWQLNLIAPKTDQQGLRELEAISKIPVQDAQTFTDSWERTISSKAAENVFWSLINVDVDPQSGSIGFGPGGSNLKSTGVFELQRNGNRIAVTIAVTHRWSDEGFKFDPNDPFYHESRVLELHKKAKRFLWSAEWVEILTGEWEIIDPFTTTATRRMIGGDTLPPADEISP